MSSKKLSRQQRKLERARVRKHSVRSTVSIGLLTAAVCIIGPSEVYHHVPTQPLRLLDLRPQEMVTVDPTPAPMPVPPSIPAAAPVQRSRWMSDDIERQRAHLATLEAILLEDAILMNAVESYKCSLIGAGRSLPSDLIDRLMVVAFQTDATRSLVRFSLGEAYMRSLHERLSTMPSIDPLDESLETEPLQLYDTGPDGNDFLPTPEGIATWKQMQSRLVRRKSALAKALPPPFHPNA